MSRRSLGDIMSHTVVGFQNNIFEPTVARLLIERVGMEKANEMFEKSFQDSPAGDYEFVWDLPDEAPIHVLIINMTKPVEELTLKSISHIEFSSGNQICPMVLFTVE